jgi:hypothetical protein
MNIRIKLAGEYAGRKYAVLIPCIIDSDGEVTITYMAAWAAVTGMQAEMFPESVKDRSPKPAIPRKYQRKGNVKTVLSFPGDADLELK